MNPRKNSGGVWPAVALLWLGTALAGQLLLADRTAPADERNDTGAAGLYLLGPARALLGAQLYERADLYFHKGVPHHHEEALSGLFTRWKKIISPDMHAHREGDEVEEMIPWLYLATRADPENIEPFLVAAYWLQSACNRPQDAMKVLNEAAIRNPKAYQPHFEKARLLLRMDDLPGAARSLETAYALLRQDYDADPEQKQIDSGGILTLRALLYEAQARKEEALAVLQLQLELQPEKADQIRGKIKELQTNPAACAAAEKRLRELFTVRQMCDHDHEHEHEHDHDEHGH